MNCPSCGAPLHIKPDGDSLKCEFCHSVYFPEKDDDGVRVLGEPAGEACPVCNTALVQAAIAKVRIEYCTQCHGMLIPMGAFQPLIGELRTVGGGSAVQPMADHSDLNRKIGCPRCHAHMDAHFYSGPGNVIIDSCETCALIWLDRGELMHIVHAPDVADRPETAFSSDIDIAAGDEAARIIAVDRAERGIWDLLN